MADTIISTVTSTPVVMTGLNDSTFVTAQGAILTSGAVSAVTMQQATNLTVLGALGHNVGGDLVFLDAASFPTVLIGAGGSVTNTANDAIGGTYSGNFNLVNHGIVHGEVAAVAVRESDGLANLELVNTGTMTGVSNGIRTGMGTSGISDIANSGVISGGTNGIFVDSGHLRLFNSGEIIGKPTSDAVDAQFASSATIDNTGTLFGHVRLSAFDDFYRGEVGTVFGAVFGGAGDDAIRSGANDDDLRGEAGNDRLRGNDGDDSLDGGTNNDLLVGGNGDDVLRGSFDNDLIEGGAGSDVIDGGSGIDTATYARSAQGVEIDLVLGRAAGGDAEGDTISFVENLTGTAFSDVLRGEGLANTLLGGRAKDTINGRAGDDVLEGEGGNDVATGGSGADVFVFAPGDGADTIRDFTDDVDTLDLFAFNFADASAALAFATVKGADVVFDFGDGDRVTLNGAAGFFADLADDLNV